MSKKFYGRMQIYQPELPPPPIRNPHSDFLDLEILLPNFAPSPYAPLSWLPKFLLLSPLSASPARAR